MLQESTKGTSYLLGARQMINCTGECSGPLRHCILGMLISHIFIRTRVWVRKSHWQFYSNSIASPFPEGMEQTLFSSLCPTSNFFPQVLNIPVKTCQYVFPALSLESSPPTPHWSHWQEKPMTARSWQIVPNTVSPQAHRGFTEDLSQSCLSFPSGLQTELRMAGHMLDFGSQHA